MQPTHPPSGTGYLHCAICDRTRTIAPHRRARHPLVNAYNWLICHCEDGMAPLSCGITYAANGDPTEYVWPYGVMEAGDGGDRATT